MINILITGANGQLGSCIRDIEPQYENFNFIYTDYKELNICDIDDVNTFFAARTDINYCINCAAYTAVDNAESDVDKANEINALGPKNLAVACSKNNTVLIHVSTDFVFDGKSSTPYSEQDVPKPINIYGTTKLNGEREISKIFEKYFIFRTSWLYSEHGNNFMKTMLRLTKTKDELSVVNDQLGTPTYARDLATIILNLISERNEFFGLYHYSNEGIVSWFDFAKEIFKEQKLDIKLNPIKSKDYITPAERPQYSVLDKSKIKKVLGINIPFWKDSLVKCLKKIDLVKT